MVKGTLVYIPIENSNNFSMLVHGITADDCNGEATVSGRSDVACTERLRARWTPVIQNGKRLETAGTQRQHTKRGPRAGMRLGSLLMALQAKSESFWQLIDQEPPR